MNRDQRREDRRTSNERLFIQVVDSSDHDLVGTTLSCHALDVSSGGLRVQADRFLPVGCHLDLWVDNSARPGKFFLTSDVRWIRTLEDRFEFGVQLHEGAATDIQEWRELLG
ncbi:MAG: PilZ domain-containing protein [Pseudomonadales bacterium]|nr:PilZ domain-containing protein [Pseudomonadales bacterium]